MTMSRRHFVLTGVSLLACGATGCASKLDISRHSPIWPAPAPESKTAKPYTPSLPVAYPSPQVPPRSTNSQRGGLKILSRKSWARGGPVRANLNPMGAIRRITVHHEGGSVVDFNDLRSTRARLEYIRRFHLKRGFGDIGYHYIIDRAGYVHEGRPLRYQGAHVSENNPHNLGVMVLGNFNDQYPTDAQLVTLQTFVRQVRWRFNVPIRRIYTHQELKPTTCPGSTLQPIMVQWRRGKQLT